MDLVSNFSPETTFTQEKDLEKLGIFLIIEFRLSTTRAELWSQAYQIA
jgi:hypothetical protein